MDRPSPRGMDQGPVSMHGLIAGSRQRGPPSRNLSDKMRARGSRYGLTVTTTPVLPLTLTEISRIYATISDPNTSAPPLRVGAVEMQ